MISDDAVCYRHSDRSAAVACQRCDKTICPSCMNQASVGFHCPDCLKAGKQPTVNAATIFQPKRPPIIVALIAINVIAFLWQNNGEAGLVLEQHGVLIGLLVQAGQWSRIITSAFLHADLLHIGFNMYALWIFGRPVHDAVGWWRFSLIYLGGLLGGAAAVVMLAPLTPTYGASGAVLGLAGGLAAMLWARGILITQTPLGGLLLLNLALPLLVPRISFGGHLGGIAGGFAVGWLISWLPERYGQSQLVTYSAVGLALAGLVALSLYGPVVSS